MVAKRDLNTIFIERPNPIFRDDVLIAFMMVESGMNHKIQNSLGYSGVLQIGSEMIDDVNRILKILEIDYCFSMSDRLNEAYSVEIWYIIQWWYGSMAISPNRIDYDIEKAWRVWNPKGTPKYIERIKKEINK